jgi:hypothetical protein
MYSWNTLHQYILFNERWFESADAYAPADEHLAVFREIMSPDWNLRRNGMNLGAALPGTELPEQGWKLHVSASSQRSAEVLRLALPVLAEAGVRFKFLADRRLTGVMDSKMCSRGASGKFLTIYPRTEEEFRRLAKGLADALDSLAGPYVLSDRRVPGSRCVSYRYGGFQPLMKLEPSGVRMACIKTPDGEYIPDVRHPYFSPPEWAEDPFGAINDDDEQAGALAGGRFIIEQALSFSSRGGVYRGVDKESGRAVVIKEARPFIELDSRGTEAAAVLVKEYAILRELEDTGYFARPVAFFEEWEHSFLVEEYVDGDHLGLFAIGNNPLHRIGPSEVDFGAYWERMRPFWIQLADAIREAHSRGVILGDLSFTNTMIEAGTGRIKIIDLEAAVRPGLDPPLHIYTAGLASDRFARTGISDEANDYHALGGIILGSVALLHSFLGFQPEAQSRLLDELNADLGLPPEVAALITDLRAEQGARLADPAAISRRITELPLTPSRPSAGKHARLTLPAREAEDAAHLARLREQAEDTVRGICGYIAATADLRRRDRLFPADLGVFETNPLSVAYGACGVAHALHLMTGEVPPKVRGWLLREPATSSDYPPGLYIGQAGIAWVLDEIGYQELALRLMREASRHELLFASPGVFTGAAGFGLACLRLWQRTGEESLLDDAVRVGSWLTAHREHDERGAFWRDAQGEIPVGYAHGGSGIAGFLLYLSLATDDSRLLALGRDAVEFELAQAGHLDGRFAGFPGIAADDPATAKVLKCYWDEGSAGVGTTAVRYLAVQRDEALRQALDEIVPDTCRKYAVLPQLFHGLAGMGNFLLDLWELSGDSGYLSEAWRVAEGVLIFRTERPEGFVFPGEQALRETTDLASGSAGVGLFLHRLLSARAGTRTNGNFLPDELLPAGQPASRGQQ